MHVQIATFALNGITEHEYHHACQQETPVFAVIDGLIAKTWLRNPATQTYGAVYHWRDHDAYQAYISGEVWAAVASDSALTNVKSTDYDVFDDLTQATSRGVRVTDGEGAV